MKKKKYVKPVLETDEFVPQEYIATCYRYQAIPDSAGVILEPCDKEIEGVKYNYMQVGTVNKECIGTGQDTTEGMFWRPLTKDSGEFPSTDEGGNHYFIIDNYAEKQFLEWGWTKALPNSGSGNLMNVVCFYKEINTEEVNAS